MKTLLLTAGLTSIATIVSAETRVLTVYAPDYFGSEWGPGPKIEELFEARCGTCDLQFVTGDVLPRLLIEGARTQADAVIGLNTDVTKQARETGLFAPHGQDNSVLTLPIAWTDDVFLPFNYGYTAFVYDKTRLPNPPASFDDLLDASDDLRLVIQDPRSSISGLALMLWVKAVYGDAAQGAWEKLAPKILTVTPGWSESYGLFTSGEADMVLSYTTSPAYHLIAEGDDTKSAAIFPEGHYFMTELVGKIATTDVPDLADDFMAFILSPEFQSMIPLANWSYPAVDQPGGLPDGFDTLGVPAKVHFYSEDQAAALRDPALAEWRAGLSR